MFKALFKFIVSVLVYPAALLLAGILQMVIFVKREFSDDGNPDVVNELIRRDKMLNLPMDAFVELRSYFL